MVDLISLSKFLNCPNRGGVGFTRPELKHIVGLFLTFFFPSLFLPDDLGKPHLSPERVKKKGEGRQPFLTSPETCWGKLNDHFPFTEEDDVIRNSIKEAVCEGEPDDGGVETEVGEEGS